MNTTEFQTLLIKLDACKEAREWCNGKSLQQAWDQATNSEWMFWLLYNHPNEATDRELRLIAVKCARQVQHLMKDKRSINALDVAEKFANGEATRKELAAAWDAAWDAARDAARDVARDAAWAAARAAAWDVARDAAWAAARAAAWDAARDAAWDVAWDVARDAARDAQCKIIREYIPIIKLK